MPHLYESPDELVSLTTAANILSCSKSHLYHNVQEDTGLPYYRLQGRIRYRVQDLLDYIEARRVVPGQMDHEVRAAANG